MKLVTTKRIDCWYVDTLQDLEIVTLKAEIEEAIACDTETYVDLSKKNASALDPHSSKISMIQINWRYNEHPYLIDVIRIGIKNCMDFINRVFMNSKILKVFHNAKFDIKQFKSTFGVWIKNVACTMVAMKSLGICTGMKASIFRGHGLKDMARDYFDIILDKEEATSQWGARPLSTNQIGYAGMDVGAPKGSGHKSMLLDAFDLFTTELIRLGQQRSMEADQQAMYIAAKLEYEGMHMDLNILSKAYDFAYTNTNKYRQAVVSELGLTIYTSVDFDEDTGEFIEVQVIPDPIKKLLNNNKQLIGTINEYLSVSGGNPLNSLQAEEINGYLDELEKEANEKTGSYFDEEYFKSKYESINLIKNLLNYKKYVKLLSECDKYGGVINPNTGHAHAGFNAIGTSTGRMSSSGDLNLQQVSNTKITLELDKEDL